MATFQKDFASHPYDYFALLCMQLVGVWGVFYFASHILVQFAFIIYMATTYVMWGVIHHLKRKDFHYKIALEYVLFALVAIMLLGVLILKP